MRISNADQKATQKSDFMECNLRLENLFFAPSNSIFGCVDVPGIYLVCYEMHISNAISSSPNPKKSISKLCWLEMACPQFEELVSGISNAGCEFRMAYLIVLRISRKAHKIYKMYISLDKICISNSEMLSPDDNACDLVVEFFGGFKSVFEGSFFHISNCVLHLFLHLYIGYISGLDSK